MLQAHDVQHILHHDNLIESDHYISDLAVNSSLINDRTIDWDVTVPRPWLYLNRLNKSNKPPAMLLLTNFGWNHPQPKASLEHYRGIRERDLIQGVVNHPWFHPTAWQEIEDGTMSIDPNTRYYVFLDVCLCAMKNWPVYGGQPKDNADTLNGRTFDSSRVGSCQSVNVEGCDYQDYVLDRSRLFQTAAATTKQANLRREFMNNARLIIWDCKGSGYQERKKLAQDIPISMISQSSMVSNVDQTNDQGLIARPVTNITLSPRQIQEISTCEAERNRNIFFSFAGDFRGNGSPARESLKQFHDNNQIIVTDRLGLNDTGYNYSTLLQSSIFAATPRGDNKYSYRFTEALSAGAIPVVMSDDWMFPFRPELIEWGKCAVIVPELKGDQVKEILENIPVEKRCQMRQYCWWIYQNYIATDSKVIKGIVEGMELVAQGKKSPFAGFLCSETNNDTCYNK